MIKDLEVTLITGLPKEAEPPFKKISGPKTCEQDEEFRDRGVSSSNRFTTTGAESKSE